MPEVKKFLSPQEQTEILNAVREAEKNTSGEIRVHLERSVEGEVLDRAAYIFKKLGMHKTEKRNGVLFYLAVNSRKFAVIGDAGINQVVPEGFWDQVIEMVRTRFSEDRYGEGLAEGIRMAGEHLRAHFPYLIGDVNELSDEISFGNPSDHEK